jgi:hypothetical protein
MNVTLAATSLAPDGEFIILDGDYSTIEWIVVPATIPTQAEIDAEVIRLQAEYDSQEYARKRKAEYDALNQFEMQYDDKANGTTTWEDAIVAIKTKYPKG